MAYVLYLFVTIMIGIGGFYLHRFYTYEGPSLVNKLSTIPKILPDNYTKFKDNADKFWGTYRSHCYFGMKTRSQTSPLMGVLWYAQPKRDMVVPMPKHWCSTADKLTRYGWIEHDGVNFGVQEILEQNLMINISYVKRLGGNHGGDWMMRVRAAVTDKGKKKFDNKTLLAFIIYFALDTPSMGKLRPMFAVKNQTRYVRSIEGEHPDLGRFNISFSSVSNLIDASFLVTNKFNMNQIKELIITGTDIRLINTSYAKYYMHLENEFPAGTNENSSFRFVAVQFIVKRKTKFDVLFESASFNRSNHLKGPVFVEELKKRRKEFNERFDKTFNLHRKRYYDDDEIGMAKHALSNMLGGLAHFHGYAKLQSANGSKAVRYGPLTLFTTIPSRAEFPRGILWDTGFNLLMVKHWDRRLALEIMSSWLDLMNEEGWIPREIVLGAEAEAQIPSVFLVQRDNIANPPTFFYLLKLFLNENNFRKNKYWLSLLYPRLKLWYHWYNVTQRGRTYGSYRWSGRNETTNVELNPKTVSSGMDDYPRASHPSADEYHLDLYAWMALSADVMTDLAQIVGDKKMHSIYEATSKWMHNEDNLDKLHWNPNAKRYCDFGLHSRAVKLEKAPLELDKQGVPKLVFNQELIRVVNRVPHLRLVSDTFGYVSLYPMFLRLLSYKSQKLGVILNQLKDPKLLWTPYGLRSLATTSPLYNQRNMEKDPPYWRNGVWVNMNYLALASLHYYSEFPGPHQKLAYEIYRALRAKLVTNVMKQYQRTGYLWERYDDITGEGQGSHPFTGWTSLVVLIMAEQYD